MGIHLCPHRVTLLPLSSPSRCSHPVAGALQVPHALLRIPLPVLHIHFTQQRSGKGNSLSRLFSPDVCLSNHFLTLQTIKVGYPHPWGTQKEKLWNMKFQLRFKKFPKGKQHFHLSLQVREFRRNFELDSQNTEQTSGDCMGWRLA